MSTSRFKRFVKLCDERRAALGLSGWNISYETKALEDAAAQTLADGAHQRATITLDNTHGDIDEWDIAQLATHELLHCLFARYDELAKSRWATEDEIDATEESIVCLLTKIITPSSRRKP